MTQESTDLTARPTASAEQQLGQQSRGPDLIVGEWLVQRDLHRVVRGEETVQIEPRIFHVLLCLAEQPGRVVSREWLLETVWSDAIVNEESLTRAISELRHIFGDDPREPRYIETIRKGGYRLIAATGRSDLSASQSSGSHTAVVVGLDAGRPHWSLARVALAAAAACAAVIILAWLWKLVGPLAASPNGGLLETVPFTSYPGSELRPAISPDGSRVAFAWTGNDGSNLDIYVKQRNTETPLRLTDHPGRDTAPTWSPDGSTVAFIRAGSSGSAIFSVPAIGGAERLIYSGPSLVDGLDWSPDGSLLVLSERAEPVDPCRLSLLSLETMRLEHLTSPPAQFTGDVRPAFSPDGSQVAFVRGDRIGLNDIFTIPTAGGEAERLTHGGSGILGFDWTPDGKQLVFASITRGPFGLWKMAKDGGGLHRLPANVEWISNPSISNRAGSMVLEARSFELNVWQILMDDPERPRHPTDPFIGSTRIDTQAVYSPDGRAVAFISGRSGHLEIWVCDADGSDPMQLTHLEATLMGNPRWSPNGRYIAFYAPAEESSAVFVVDVAAGNLRLLPNLGANDRVTSWSRDGRWIYIGSDRSGEWQLYRMSPDGQQLVQITYDGGITATESVDGSTLYFVRPDRNGIWQMPVGGGEASLLVDAVAQPASRDWDNWVVTGDGIYFTRPEIGGHSVAFFDFATGEAKALTRVPSPPARRSLAVSPDGRSILYSRVEHQESDLMVVEQLP